MPWGGVLILVPFKYTASSYGCHYCSKALEAIAVKIEFSNKCLIIINVYLPPSFFSEVNFLSEFKLYFDGLNLLNKDFVIVGDFNFPYIDWNNETLFKFNVFNEQLLNFCLLNSLSQVVAEPTRGNKILDLAFVNHCDIVERFYIT